jgi:hypothetical protein
MPDHEPNRRVSPRPVLLPIGLIALLAGVGVYGCRTLATIEYDTPETPSAGALAVRAASEETAGAGHASPASDTVYTARDSGILVGPLVETGTLDAGVFWPGADRDDRFMVGNGEDEGAVMVTRMMRVQDDGSVEVVRAPDDAEAAPDFGARTVLACAPEGEVVVRFNAASKIESTFDPAALFLPASLKAGESIERPFTVDAVGPRFGTGTGEGSITVNGHGTQAVRTPAGDYEAFVFSSESSFQIGPATITRTRRAWVAVDAGSGLGQGSIADLPGIVAEESGQTVKVFGISFSSKAWVSVLAE